MSSPLRVYLDSSDYSLLSDAQRETGATTAIRERLLSWARSRTVQFVYSGAHISEMAPLGAGYTAAAAARADLLVDLCERNAFISIDRLFARELSSIGNGVLSTADVLSSDGDWFPDVTDAVSPISWARQIREFRSSTRTLGLNRGERRRFEKQFFKGPKLRRETSEWLSGEETSIDYSELMTRYPMRERDARVIGRYVIGVATAEEANAAFQESLRDPRWVMRWFAENHAQLTPVAEWLRGPSRRIRSLIEELAGQAARLRRLPVGLVDDRELPFGPSARTQLQDESILNTARRLSSSVAGRDLGNVSVDVIDSRCRGFSVCMRTLHASMWDSFSKQPRVAKDSDFVDVVHAAYAPYVDIFRADAFMTQHIARQVMRDATEVVSSAADLVDVIERRVTRNEFP